MIFIFGVIITIILAFTKLLFAASITWLFVLTPLIIVIILTIVWIIFVKAVWTGW